MTADMLLPVVGASAVALRSVDLVVPDLATARRFYTDVWGLTEVAGPEIVLRATGADHHVLVLHKGDPALHSITFRSPTQEAVRQAAQAATQTGARLLGEPGPVDWPGGGFGVAFVDPQGRTLRLVHGDATRTPDVPIGDRPTRLSHVNINSADTDATARFFTEALGFRLSDRSKIMAFVRCNSDHHAVVIADADVNGLNHVAFMMPSLEGVMRGSGRMVDHGYPIGWGVGRHGPGDNVFAYFVDPFGIVIEYTAEVLQVDDAYRVGGPADWTWPPGRTDHWGIAPPKSEAVKRAQLAIGLVPA
jgi:catechol 2,3-dioxygenase-like lactoylglutathione lyase family enzyme